MFRERRWKLHCGDNSFMRFHCDTCRSIVSVVDHHCILSLKTSPGHGVGKFYLEIVGHDDKNRLIVD